MRGMKMPGQMGQARRTVQNLKVIQVREAENLLLIQGAIPGAKGDYVVIRQAPSAENGEIVAALIDGEATVKTFQRKGGQVWLLPHNPAYEPIDGTHATILGKVTAVLRRL